MNKRDRYTYSYFVLKILNSKQIKIHRCIYFFNEYLCENNFVYFIETNIIDS